MELTYENILENLANSLPEFTQSRNFINLLEIESDDLPYVVFGALFNYSVSLYQNKDYDLLKKMSYFIETASSSSDSKLQELIMFGFLEQFDSGADYYNEIVNTFGKKTKGLLKKTIKHNKKIADSVDPELKINL